MKRCFTNHITSGSTDLFFAAGEALGGDVACLHGEDKSERSVTAFKSSAEVSVLNSGGGTSSSGSALLFSAWKSVNCPRGLRLGAGALSLRVRHRLVSMSKPRQKSPSRNFAFLGQSQARHR